MQPCQWAHENFAKAQLADKRRTNRLVDSMSRMKECPGDSLPAMLGDPNALNAFYRLVDQSDVTHQAVIEPHIQLTLEKASQEKQHVVLFLQDPTELEYTGRKVADTMGLIGCGKHQRGYLAHHALAVVPQTNQILGLASQTLFTRSEKEPGETRYQRSHNPRRQSLLWSKTSQAIGPAPEGCRWVEVCDREADNFQYFWSANNSFVVRSRTNRRAIVRDDNGLKRQVKLHDWMRSLPAVSSRQVQVRAQPEKTYRDGRKPRPAQPARKASCQISWTAVKLPVPDRAANRHTYEPLVLWVVRIWEIDAPEGVEPLEWILLCDMPRRNIAEAEEVIDWYQWRPVVEDLHKGQKTGCRIEEVQFTETDRLEPVIGMLSVLAVSLLQLRHQARHPEAKHRRASKVVPPLWVKVLSHWRWPGESVRWEMSVEEFYLALARLGGHQNRKGDGLPGWQTLWKGFRLLMQRVQGYRSCQRSQEAEEQVGTGPP